MIGAWFVAWEVTKQYKDKKYESDDKPFSGIGTDRSSIDTPDECKVLLL
jgi:hypothetical protein